MATNDLILLGAGGHCKACIDVIEAEGKFKIAGIVDLKANKHQRVMGYEVIASDEDLGSLVKQYQFFFITIGSIRNPTLRSDKFNALTQLGALFPVIISPHAYVSKSAQLGKGTIVMHQAMVNAQAMVGENCIINSKALIEHESTIGNHCNLSTGSVINGTCVIGDRVFIGSNAMISNNIQISSDVHVGAGSIVMKSIEAPGLYINNMLKSTL